MEDDILIRKYEALLYNKESIYFDSDEFETIISHYMLEGKYTDALEALVYAELCHPGDVELALHKIRIMISIDNLDKAFELLLILENKTYNLLEINIYKGDIHVMTGDVEEAIKEYDLAIEKCSGVVDYELNSIPEMLMEYQYFEEAIEFFHRLEHPDNVNAQIFFNIGYCYEQIEDMENAEKYYEKSLDEDPFNERTWIILGALHLNTMNIDKAIDAFEFAYSINNSEHVALLCKVASLIQSEEYGEAINCIVEVLTAKPNNAITQDNLEEYYSTKQDIEEAEKYYMEAIRLSKDMKPAYWDLSNILYSQGDIEAAIQIIDKAIEIEPNNEEYLYFRGQCFVTLSHDSEKFAEVLQNPDVIKKLKYGEYDESTFINKHKKATFYYSVGDIEKCCEYLLETILIDSKGLELFIGLFPDAEDDAYIINYLGIYLK
jgi:tetratricopeptide (TPR) repeat protein